MTVLVTHPGRQHSHQAALALDLPGLLAGYWAGVPAHAEQVAGLPTFLARRLARYAAVPLPRALLRWHPATPALRRFGDALLPRGAAAWVDFLACRRFDRWAAAGLRRLAPRPAAVLACEISALTTFRAARRLGLVTLLDAPSLHHSAQDRLHGTTDSPALHRRIVAVKDAEIDLADHIVTVSELARETYLAAGVAPERVHALTLGADLDLFNPAGPTTPAEPADPEPGCVFLFSGATIHRKGFDLLLAAFERVHRQVPSARLRIVGPQGDAFGLLVARPGDMITAVGPVSQPELAAELRRAHCLVLPSRNDSFGMVVPEALACGIPVVVSSMVGAQVLVEPGQNGWIVPSDDVDALTERMLRCAENTAALRAMGQDCRRSAAAATWPAYHRRFAALIAGLTGPGAAGLKILHVIPTYVPAWRHGGPIVAVHGLAKALAARGHEVTVYTTDVHGAGRLDVPLGTPVALDGVTVWYFPVGFPRRLYRAPAMAAQLARTVADFDLVHLHSVFLWPTTAAARAAERAGVPYLLAPRGMLVPELLERRGNLRKRLWIALAERRTIARAAGLHVTTDREAADVARLGLEIPRIFCVPNGLTLEVLDGAPASQAVTAILGRQPLLLHLGRVSWKKGLDRLIPALAEIPGATLAIAGNDDEGCGARLAALARQNGVAERVVFLGAVHGADKAALLAGAALFVLPSYSENFANAVVEAMAAGLPVVITPEVGLAKLVERTGCGVVTPGEPHALATALRRLLEAPEKRQEMGRRGVATAAEEFDWARVALRMEGVYGEIIENSLGPRKMA